MRRNFYISVVIFCIIATCLQVKIIDNVIALLLFAVTIGWFVTSCIDEIDYLKWEIQELSKLVCGMNTEAGKAIEDLKAQISELAGRK